MESSHIRHFQLLCSLAAEPPASTAATDAAYDQLAKRNAELEQEKAALAEQLEAAEHDRAEQFRQRFWWGF